jgi:hypothetical protein
LNGRGLPDDSVRSGTVHRHHCRRLRRNICARGAAFALVAFVAADPAAGQLGAGGGGGRSYALEEGERNLEFAGIPVPNYSDVLGWSLGVVGMAYYKLDRHDDLCPPSSTGLFGFYSENNSWMGAAFQKVHYDEDSWRGTLAFGKGSIKYQFSPAAIDPGLPDIFLDYTTATSFFFLDGARRVWRRLYLGLGVLTWSAEVRVEPDLVETEDERYTGPGVTGEWDDTNNVFAATRGWKASGRYLVYDAAFGADRDFTKLNLTLTGYRELGDSTRVLAGRLLTEAAFGDVPFSGQSIVSGNRNLRGYSDGRYRADKLLVLEAEYRWNFWRRWGAVAFAGVAFSADEVSTMTLRDALPGGGVGLRFLMIEQYRINARVDYGWGKNDQALYIAVGEAY